MDPPPPPLSSSSAAAAASVAQLGYSDSLDSASLLSRTAAAAADDSSSDEPLAQVPGGAKLRLMCSYGGHIIPRPHDKSLCYVGGETRIVVAERHLSLSILTSRLSKTLLNGRPFTLKYQLPNEDLDSLISVTSDEDLENMVEEYDRVSSTKNTSSLKASNLRLRLFLFLAKPETAASMGALLDDAKSESWFVDALNGSGLMPRNLSDSAAGLDCLLTGGSSDSANQADFFGGGSGGESEKNGNAASAAAVTSLQEVHSVPESAFVESNTSSSGSSSTSSPCLANLPPIRVRVGIEEQFAQMGFPAAQAVTSALPPNPTVAVNSGETTMNRINSDDEIAAQKFRKPPLPTPLQPQLFNKHGGGGGGVGGGNSLASPDSVTSDSSIVSANSLSKPMYYQEQIQVASREGGRAPVSPNTASDGGASDQGSRNQAQQVQDSGYGLPSMPAQSDQQQQQQQLQQQHQQQQQQLQQQQQQQQQQLQQQQQQQQLVHAAQYMTMHHHHPAGQVPMSPYYTMYAPPPQQQQQLHHQNDPQQQYPVYLMPVAPQSQQQYKMALQSNMPDPNGVAPAPSFIASQSPQGAYKDNIPPLYPPKTVSPTMPEMTTQSVYQTSVTPAPQLVQIPSNQYQQQYMGYTTQMHHPSQSIAVPPSATAPNYSYEYANEQAFYPQHQPAPLPPHYQSMTPAAAAAAVALSEESKQLAAAAAYSAADQSHTQQA